MQVIHRPGVRTAFLVLTFGLLMAGDAVRFTLGWWSFGVLGVAMAGASVWVLVVQRDRWRIGGLPYPLVAFLVLATLSILWSFYPAATGLGLLTTWLIALSALAVAVTFSWAEILRGLGLVLRGILGLSLLFELFVSLVIRAPILPLFTQPGVDYSDFDKLPKLLYWSRNELFQVLDEGRIQGILGNANNLGMLALLAVIVFGVQLADRSIQRSAAIGWLAVAGLTLALTRSATVSVTLLAVLLATGAILLVRRAATVRSTAWTYAGIVGAFVAAVATVLALQRPILAVLGKSPDLTGRFGIWNDVITIAQQRPVQGWGWVSYWMPWAAPFDNLTFRYGVRQLQAHDVWLDVWLQLGVIGLVVFAILTLTAFARSWQFAVDRRQDAPGQRQPYRALELLPVLVLVALLVQSLAESRLIVEYGFFLLVLIAVKTRRDPVSREGGPDVRRLVTPG